MSLSSVIHSDTPVIYQIRVSGTVNISSDHFSGMQITVKPLDGGEKQTQLIGQLPDQSALNGVLNALYNLHLPVLSVEVLNSYQA